MAALVVRLTGLGGGSGGCLVGCVGTGPWVEDWLLEEVRGTLATADEAVRRVFVATLEIEEDGELEETEEEGNEVAGLWTGVWGKASVPDSVVELISHLGEMTDCFGGSGSRRVSLRASGSGT